MTAETPHLPAVEPVEPPAGPETGTGGLNRHRDAQAENPVDIVARVLVGDDWDNEVRYTDIGSREDVAQYARESDAALRPVHYREVATSLDRLGHHDAARDVRSAPAPEARLFTDTEVLERVQETAAAVARTANNQIRDLEQQLADERQRSLSFQGRCETAEREAKQLRAGRNRAIENAMTLSERVDEITSQRDALAAKLAAVDTPVPDLVLTPEGFHYEGQPMKVMNLTTSERGTEQVQASIRMVTVVEWRRRREAAGLPAALGETGGTDAR
jgi:chromosome segregation ATPase